MFVATLECDLLLGDVRSLKQKRGLVRPIVHGLRRFEVSAAEVDEQDVYRRARIGVAAIAAEPQHCREVIEQCERFVAARPEVELLETSVRLFHTEDE